MASHRKLIDDLISLTQNWNDYEDVPTAQKLECRILGEKLHKEGGKALMRNAYYEAKDANRSCTVVQAYWDGIGEWRW